MLLVSGSSWAHGDSEHLVALGPGGAALITVLVIVLAAVMVVSRRRALRAAQAAIEELRTARRAAGLLSAVMDSIGDGVGVVDSKGRFLLQIGVTRGSGVTVAVAAQW